MVLVFDGQVVHAISRLDPYYQPIVVPLNCRGEISPLHRFYVGKSKMSVTFAQKPEDLLAPLLVSKRWNYIGANLFYSGNKFCFSSRVRAEGCVEYCGMDLARLSDVGC
ncbi:hypothetical protein BGZ61DRAFT_443683 [Ilyonectria robusta]|uniref:uncharacterized protein n=1 Tax=Ilyonectria robusta TaxID=1079257 RepID=UPI001E8D386F|nr:uncharacterized protein BGZ61DRAFT_443683 [Ilyonectria robusta]KAH8735086.1 hypothetical protein BGZ61DRAFT_443683 [Ilyonectria robusta]